MIVLPRQPLHSLQERALLLATLRKSWDRLREPLMALTAAISAERTPIGALFVERVALFERRLQTELGSPAAASAPAAVESLMSPGGGGSSGSARYAVKLFRALVTEVYGFLRHREEYGATIPPPPLQLDQVLLKVLLLLLRCFSVSE